MFDLAAGRLRRPTRAGGILRLTLVAVAVAYVMIGVSSPQPVDVIYAVMEGATRLLTACCPTATCPGTSSTATRTRSSAISATSRWLRWLR